MMRMRNYLYFSLGVIFLIILSSPLPAEEKPYRCHQRIGEILIDGEIKEKAWERAEIIDTFYILGTDEPAVSKSRAYLLWDKDFLYIGVDMEDKDLWADREGHDEDLWNNDVIELFLKPREDSFHYYEFEINPLNATLDLFYPRRGAGRWERWKGYESGIISAVTLKGTLNEWRDIDKGWTVEFKIPFKSFQETVSPPRLGDWWRFAICRYNYSVHLPSDYSMGRELSTSTPIKEKAFHFYEYYQVLIFAE